jgi:lysophospholipase L1-like esterase
VVSIPDYGYTPFGKAKQQTISKAIDEFNNVNKSITEKHGVKYFNITTISRKGFEDPTLVAADGLHPSGKMYGMWTELILDKLF